MKTLFLVFFLDVIFSALALNGDVVKPFDPANLVDLTHTFTPSVPHWTEEEKFRLRALFNGTKKEGYWYLVEVLSTGTHVGTHLDAPCHFQKIAWCVTDIPLERLVVPAVVVDIRRKVGDNGDYFLTPGDLRDWELRHGTIPKGSVLFVLTGWGRFWNDTSKYWGTEVWNINDLHFPGVGKDAADWLLANRDIYGLGVDTLSVDYGHQQPPIVHIMLSAKNIYNLENVANLERLPPTGTTLFVMPMKLEGASGAPARLLAVINSKQSDPWEKVVDFFQDIGVPKKRMNSKFTEFLRENADFTEFENAKNKTAKLKALAKQVIAHSKEMSAEVAREALEFFRPYKEDLGSLWDDLKG